MNKLIISWGTIGNFSESGVHGTKVYVFLSLSFYFLRFERLILALAIPFDGSAFKNDFIHSKLFPKQSAFDVLPAAQFNSQHFTDVIHITFRWKIE